MTAPQDHRQTEWADAPSGPMSGLVVLSAGDGVLLSCRGCSRATAVLPGEPYLAAIRAFLEQHRAHTHRPRPRQAPDDTGLPAH